MTTVLCAFLILNKPSILGLHLIEGQAFRYRIIWTSCSDVSTPDETEASWQASVSAKVLSKKTTGYRVSCLTSKPTLAHFKSRNKGSGPGDPIVSPGSIILVVNRFGAILPSHPGIGVLTGMNVLDESPGMQSVVFPNEPLNVGSTWTTRSPEKHVLSPFVGAVVSRWTVSSFERIGGRQVVLLEQDVTSEMNAPTASAPYRISVSGHGITRISVTSGLVQSRTLDVRALVTVSSKTGTFLHHFRIDLER